jgi:hypothetical protein
MYGICGSCGIAVLYLAQKKYLKSQLTPTWREEPRPSPMLPTTTKQCPRQPSWPRTSLDFEQALTCYNCIKRSTNLPLFYVNPSKNTISEYHLIEHQECAATIASWNMDEQKNPGTGCSPLQSCSHLVGQPRGLWQCKHLIIYKKGSEMPAIYLSCSLLMTFIGTHLILSRNRNKTCLFGF